MEMMKRCVIWCVLAGVGISVARGQELRVWSLAASAVPEQRNGWKAAGMGGDFKNGVAVGNGSIVLFVAPQAGIFVVSELDSAVRTGLRLVTAKGEALKIGTVKLLKSDEAEANIQVTGEGLSATFRIVMGKPLVGVVSATGTGAVEVASRFKYVVLPDFFGNDVVFVPTRYQSDRIGAVAENFLLGMLEGGNGIVMAAWPLPSKGGKAEVKEQQVDVLLAGKGPDRLASGCSLEFAGNPVFIGLIAGKGVWYEQKVGGEPAQKPVQLIWNRPFEAKWRVDFINKEGACSQDMLSKIMTWDASYRSETPDGKNAEGIYTRGGKPIQTNLDLRPEVNGIPKVCLQGLWPYYMNPAWIDDCSMQDKGRMFVAMYADKQARDTAKDGVPLVNVFETVLVYPLDRRRETAMTAFTVTDMMREALGLGPCGYVLDLEGIKAGKSGGSKTTLATCGTWEHFIEPILLVTSGKSATITINEKKKTLRGLKTGEKLASEDENLLVEKLNDMTLFVTAVNKRLQQYRQFYNELKAYCEEQAKANPKIKPAAEIVMNTAVVLDKRLSENTLKSKNKQRDEWEAKIDKLIVDVKAGNYSTYRAVGDIRDSLAAPQDILLSFARRSVKNIRQEAAAVDTADPEVVKFLAHVRELCHAVSRNRHGFEGN